MEIRRPLVEGHPAARRSCCPLSTVLLVLSTGPGVCSPPPGSSPPRAKTRQVSLTDPYSLSPGWPHEKLRKHIYIYMFSELFGLPRGTQEAPGQPKTSPDAPRAAQDVPRGLQCTPKQPKQAPQDAPKGPQGAYQQAPSTEREVGAGGRRA